MYEGDRNRSFTHCRCYALEAASANIAYREYSGQTCFEQMWSTRQRPLRGGQIVRRQIRSGLNESIRVERNAAVQPMCVWNCASHNEDMAYVARLQLSGYVIPPAHALKMISAVKSCDL